LDETKLAKEYGLKSVTVVPSPSSDSSSGRGLPVPITNIRCRRCNLKDGCREDCPLFGLGSEENIEKEEDEESVENDESIEKERDEENTENQMADLIHSRSVCNVDGCEQPAWERRRCKDHQLSSSPSVPVTPMVPPILPAGKKRGRPKLCEVPNCKESASIGSLCEDCFTGRRRKSVDTSPEKERPRKRTNVRHPSKENSVNDDTSFVLSSSFLSSSSPSAISYFLNFFSLFVSFLPLLSRIILKFVHIVVWLTSAT